MISPQLSRFGTARENSMKRVPFMSVPGSDPSAAMKGDRAQHVAGSTAPGTPVKKPKVVKKGGGTGQYALPRGK